MITKTNFIAIALTLVALPTAAFGQTSIGTVQVTDEGLPHVIDHCRTLHSMSASDRPDHEPGLAQSRASGVRLDTISLDDCKKAGLL